MWALRHDLTCYDAWDVAPAEAVGLPLATPDSRLGHAAGPPVGSPPRAAAGISGEAEFAVPPHRSEIRPDLQPVGQWAGEG